MKPVDKVLSQKFMMVRGCTTQCISNQLHTLTTDEQNCFKKCVARPNISLRDLR